MQAKVKGPWSMAEVEQFLESTVYPMRLACVGADGFPRVVSVWFGYRAGQLFCVSHQSSSLIRLLEGNPRTGFEIAPNEPPYFGVRGQGMASMAALGDATMLEELLQRYLGGAESTLGDWLLSRRDEEVLITITPGRWFSWDYRQRMKDAVKPG